MNNIVTQTVDHLNLAIGPHSLLHTRFLTKRLEDLQGLVNDPCIHLKLEYAKLHVKWFNRCYSTELAIDLMGDLCAYFPEINNHNLQGVMYGY